MASGLTRALLSDRGFRLLWGGQFVSDIGTAATAVALPLLAVLTLGATPLQAGLLVGCEGAPMLLSLPLAARIDARPKQPVMIGCDLGRAAVLLSVPAAAALGLLSMTQLYLAAVLIGVLSAGFALASQAFLPDLVPAEGLLAANARLEAGGWVATVGGPPASGLLTQAVGPVAAFVVDAASYLASAATVRAIRVRELARPAGRAARAPVRAGFRFLAGHRPLRRLIAANVLANWALLLCLPVETLFLLRGLHATAVQFGLLIGLPCLAGLAGAALVSRWSPARLEPVLRRAGWGRGAFQLAFAFARPGVLGLALAGACSAGVIFFAAIYNTAQVTYRQQLCPPAMRARVHAVSATLVGAARMLAPVAGGALATWLGLRAALVIGGVLLLATPLLFTDRAAARGGDRPDVAVEPGGGTTIGRGMS